MARSFNHRSNFSKEALDTLKSVKADGKWIAFRTGETVIKAKEVINGYVATSEDGSIICTGPTLSMAIGKVFVNLSEIS